MIKQRNIQFGYSSHSDSRAFFKLVLGVIDEFLNNDENSFDCNNDKGEVIIGDNRQIA